uniref:RNA-directed RNA polymerase n=1 Tax=Erysiphe necator associated chrysovirus 3 TaxID=2742544 RepID=A0A8E3YX60_9VIRU|nr:RNA-dependent RNA polymerase [Erysiphe necator associated chrysovirus 3]
MSKFEHSVLSRRLPQSTRKGLVKLSRYASNGAQFLGANKAGLHYEQRLANSMARYTSLQDRRGNLFAFIMPAGHGKTTLAHKYGFVDVDMLVTRKEHDDLAEDRASIIAGQQSWMVHNTKWYARLNETLDLLDYSMPVIILVHTEELALELGARPIGCLKLKRDIFERNIRDRDDLGKTFSRLNYTTLHTSKQVPNQFNEMTNADLEGMILKILNLSGMPIACPHKFEESVWNDSYHRTVPKWVLRGERAGDRDVNIHDLVRMFEQGMVPKECVDYYVRHSYVPTQFDFGVSMFEWSAAMAEIPPKLNKPRQFDVTADMVDVFAPRGSKELHRANVTIRQLIQTFDIFSHDDAYEIASMHVGEPQVFVTSILSAWKGILQNTSVNFIVKKWMGVNFHYWSDVMKSLHSYIRCSRFLMNTEITEQDRQSLMYMDLLVGRGEYQIDEMAEVTLRQSDTYSSKHLSYNPDLKAFTNEQYIKDFSRSVQIAHMRIRHNPKPVKFTSFTEFYQARHTWITKGGLVSNTLPKGMKQFSAQIFDSVAATIEEIEGRHNKKSLFEMHELYDILVGVNKHNFNVTKTMIKYEVGKKDRTLLPGSLAHFIVFCYILMLAEKQDQIGSVRLNAMGDGDIRYFDKKMSTGTFHVLYDWADFNEQHSAWEMAQVIQELENVMPDTPDYHLFCSAIIEGMYEMGLQDKDGHLHKLWRGLYSGWRGTTWINTVLNFCYVSIALLNMERLTGVSVVLMVDHGGDDLDLVLSEPSVMPTFLEIMDNMLFKANKWKQMFGKRSEFFRNTISGARVYASPTRALASFIAGDWEGAGRATVKERVVSLLDQIGKLRRRGVSNEMCQGFTMSCISHWCKVKDGEEWMNLPEAVLHGVEEQGGLGVPDISNQVWVLDKPVPEVNEEWYKVVVPDYKASKDYVKVLSDELGRFSIAIQRQEDLAKKLAEDSYDLEKSIDRMAWKKLLAFDGKPVGFRDVIEPMVNDDLMSAFIDFQITDDLTRKFDKASRYQEYINYLTVEDHAITKEQLVYLMSDGEVSIEAIDFQGDIHYQRLVPEFISTRAVIFCKAAVNAEAVDVEAASTIFKTICWMSSKIFRHMM